MSDHPRALAAQAAPAALAALAALLLTLSPLSARAQVAAPPAAAPAPAPQVEVRGFRVEGNTLLPAAVLDQRLQGRTGRLGLQQLREAAAAVQDAYRDAGYGGVVAFLPEQALDSGTVLIRVVEGRLTGVSVSGNQRFDTANIRASLPSLQEGRTPLVRRIDAQIQMANENPAKTVQVLLQPGAAVGTVSAAVTVEESPVMRLTGRLDNTGGESTGRWRAALGWQHANLWNRDHQFAAELQTAPEDTKAVRVFSFSYRAPFYARGLALDAYGAWSDVDAGTVGTAAGDLQFSGNGSIGGLRLSAYLPRWGNVDQRLMLGLEAREYRNNCTIQGLPQGACGSAGESVSVQPASLAYTAQASSDWRWGLSLALHGNLAAGGRHGSEADFEAVRPGAPRRYALLRAAGQLGLPLSEWASLALRLNAQATADPLVPGELFGIGGAQSVRGYEEREISGDSGATLSIELAGPALLGTWGQGRQADLRPVAFVDTGTVRNQAGAPCLRGATRCTLTGAGLGLRAQWREVQARLDVARALSDANSTLDGDTRAHFSLLVHF